MKRIASFKLELAWIAATTVFFGVLAYFLRPLIGYHAIGVILLMLALTSGMFLGRVPVFLLALLVSLIHNFFFIPPLHTLSIHRAEDVLMYVVFFAAAFFIGHLHASHKRLEVLKQADRLFRTLLNSVSHELKTPLTTIKGAASALGIESNQTDVPLVKDLAIQIGSETERLLKVVENMLDMTRLESGALKPRIGVCDIADVLGPAIGDKYRVDIKIDPNVKSLKCDVPLVVQALSNLLHNSFVHGGGSATIEARNGPNKSVEISITDDGPGLPTTNPEVIFDKFFREKPERGGVGLGLSIARGFIEAQQGTLRATNHPNRGAVFTVQLPAG